MRKYEKQDEFRLKIQKLMNKYEKNTKKSINA